MTSEKQSVIDIDGNIYHTVKIGFQEWMVENLKVTRFRNGDIISNIIDSKEWGKYDIFSLQTKPAYCHYENDKDNLIKYGNLYNFSAVCDERQLAPKGWHIPTENEFRVLIEFLGGNFFASKKLISTEVQSFDTRDTSPTNESGFTALLSGNRDKKGIDNCIDNFGFYWSSTGQSEPINTLAISLQISTRFSISLDYKERSCGYAVRCIRDQNDYSYSKEEFSKTANLLSQDMVLINGGEFEMGSLDEIGEYPIHLVTLNDYYISKFPVTQALWGEVMGGNPSSFPINNQSPVNMVSWHEVQDFISKLNSLTGKNYRLPTEAQWEYAAGGGNYHPQKWAGTDDEDKIDEYIWYDCNIPRISGYGIYQVGLKKPNLLGVYDMCGHIYEWCNDLYGKYPDYSQFNPTGPLKGDSYVLRGGSGHCNSSCCRVASRGYNRPEVRSTNLGFRLALSTD